MKRIAFALSTAALIVTAALAAPADDREAHMKQSGRLLGALGPMAKGEAPFDAADAAAKLQAFNEHVQTLDAAAFFPEGSGEGTRALPAIWEDFPAFETAAAEFKADAAAAAESDPQDLQALRQVMSMIGQNCSSCHETYRLPED
jgi:cytochrome c556